MSNRHTPTIEHAPGPYFYQRDKDGCDDTWNIIAADGSCVGCIHFWDKPGTREAEETEANARLFAAAPELLGALERLVRCTQDLSNAIGPAWRECEDECHQLRRACRIAFGAIGKARGVRP